MTLESELTQLLCLRQIQHSFSTVSVSTKTRCVASAWSVYVPCLTSSSSGMSSTSSGRFLRFNSRYLSVMSYSLPMLSCLCWSQHAHLSRCAKNSLVVSKSSWNMASKSRWPTSGINTGNPVSVSMTTSPKVNTSTFVDRLPFDEVSLNPPHVQFLEGDRQTNETNETNTAEHSHVAGVPLDLSKFTEVCVFASTHCMGVRVP